MILIILFGLATLIFLTPHWFTDVDCSVAVILVGGILITLLILWPIIYYSTQSEIQAYWALKSTVEKYRSNPGRSPLEGAALMQKIIENNEALASYQYWARRTLLRGFFPKELSELKPLE